MIFKRAGRNKKIRRNAIKPECGKDTKGNGAKEGTKSRENAINTKCGAVSGESVGRGYQKWRKCDKTQAWAHLEGQSMRKVYISGPITGTDDYMERFQKAEDMLTQLGHEAVNPARVNAALPTSTTHGQYMKMSFVMLGMCNTVYMMEGWQGSEGCTQELGHAIRRGIPVIFENGGMLWGSQGRQG